MCAASYRRFSTRPTTKGAAVSENIHENNSKIKAQAVNLLGWTMRNMRLIVREN